VGLQELVDEAIAQASLYVVFADSLEKHSIGGVVEEAGINLRDGIHQ